MEVPESKRWKYDRGDGRYKHRWNQDHPGHVTMGNRTVGKCPKSFTIEFAEAALNSGYEYFERRRPVGYPSRIFAVIKGTVYRAVPTLAGVSYHGFPELKPDDLPPDPAVKEAILDLAAADGSREEVEQWFKS